MGTAEIQNVAVTTGKIADISVTTAKIQDDAVTGPKIAPNAVGQSEIAANAVGTDQVLDGNITQAKLADNINQSSFQFVAAVSGSFTGFSNGTGTAFGTVEGQLAGVNSIFHGSSTSSLTQVQNRVGITFSSATEASKYSAIQIDGTTFEIEDSGILGSLVKRSVATFPAGTFPAFVAGQRYFIRLRETVGSHLVGGRGIVVDGTTIIGEGTPSAPFMTNRTYRNTTIFSAGSYFTGHNFQNVRTFSLISPHLITDFDDLLFVTKGNAASTRRVQTRVLVSEFLLAPVSFLSLRNDGGGGDAQNWWTLIMSYATTSSITMTKTSSSSQAVVGVEKVVGIRY